MYSDKEVAQWAEDAMIKHENITREHPDRRKNKLSIEIRITIAWEQWGDAKSATLGIPAIHEGKNKYMRE